MNLIKKILTKEEASKSISDLNVVIDNGNPYEDLLEPLFTDDTDTELKYYLTKSTTIEDVLTELGIYKSKSESRRNGRYGLIPYGYNDTMKMSKRSYLTIYNPSKLCHTMGSKLPIKPIEYNCASANKGTIKGVKKAKKK